VVRADYSLALRRFHVTRDIPSLITNGGFQIDQIEMAYLAPFPKSITLFA